MSAASRPLRDRDKANRRIGRLLHKYSRAARLYKAAVHETADPDRRSKTQLSLEIRVEEDLSEWVEMADGCPAAAGHTNLEGMSAEKLWRTYIGLTQVEDSFRVTKYDLGLRPIFHQKGDCTQAHILVCFLSLVMWRTLQQWMKASGLGTAPRKLLEEMAEVRSLDVLLPTGSGHDIRMRTVTKPGRHWGILLERLGFPLPNKPKRIQNVVETFAL